MRDACRRLMSWKLAGVLITAMVAAFVVSVTSPAASWAAWWDQVSQTSTGGGGGTGGTGGTGGGTLTIKKQIYICDAAKYSPTDFRCEGDFNLPSGPDSGKYRTCTSRNGCLYTASDFGAGIVKDVVARPELSSAGATTDLNEFHYVVTEDEVDELWDQNDNCTAAGFRHSLDPERLRDNGQKLVDYRVCVDYSDDCTGTTENNEEKTCTIRNYIWAGEIWTKVAPE